MLRVKGSRYGSRVNGMCAAMSDRSSRLAAQGRLMVIRNGEPVPSNTVSTTELMANKHPAPTGTSDRISGC